MSRPVFSETIHDHPQLPTDTYVLCCCCLELPCLKSLWAEYSWMGRSEVYGHMLKECFNLNWIQNENSKEQICEVCITQLRHSLQFKQRVMDSQAKLEARLTDNSKVIKEEHMDIDIELNEEIDTDSKNKDTIVKGDNIESDGGYGFDEVDYNRLDTDSMLIKAEVRESCEDSIKAIITKQCCDEDNKNKSKRKTPARKTKTNSKSTENRKVVITRQANNRKEKTKSKRQIVIIPMGTSRTNIEIRKLNYVKPRKNASLLLENSTIIPFKSAKGYFTCLYCNKQHVGFEELKKHITDNHEKIDFKTILNSINRPNDRIKADVSNITCRICKKKIDALESLVTHLTDEHNVKFNYDDGIKPANSILGYNLGDGKNKCVICKDEFLFFKTLSNHMNSHSNDHVCDVCGQCFLLPERLRAHVRLHKEAKSNKCDICSKFFSTNTSLKSHIRYMHKKLSFSCSICNKTFPSYRTRLMHLVEIHKLGPLNFNCKICSKEYTTPSSLNSHMRTEHLKIPRERKHSCDICGMRFRYPNALSLHMTVHSGEKKFECEYCHKKYARAKTLTEHLKIHRNDKRWCCGACAQAFVQKCSLRNHIKVHHADVEDGERLIIYNKPDEK